MTRANARHHLEILIGQELVQVIGRRPAKNKGRPAILYGPSRHSRGENFDLLSGALLSELSRTHGLDELPGLYQQIAAQMIKIGYEKETEQERIGKAIPISLRLGNAIQLLDAFRYHARWEAHSDAPHIILGNCPYLSILHSHPELCEIDREIISRLVLLPTEMLEKRLPDERGIPHCRFRVRQS